MLQQQITLIVSRDPGARVRAQASLPHGQTIRQVTSYGEAVSILFSECCAVLPGRVLVDPDLPDGSGLALLARIQEDSWLRGATTAHVLPQPRPEPEEFDEAQDVTDEMVLDALSFAGIP
jgi:hypothetical protein